jgi:anti-sigma factor (TIGR02949 family)
VNSTESRFRRELENLVDGRLDNSRRARLESHLDSCAECRREWQALTSIKAALRATRTDSEAPIDLAARVRMELDREDRASPSRFPVLRGRRARRFAAFAAAAATAIAIALFSIPRATDLPSAAAQDWKRWTFGRLHLELRSGSPRVISRFFADRGLSFPVPAEMIALPGYPLLGARVHSLGGRQSTFLVYRGRRNETVVCQMYEGSVGDLPVGGRVLESGGVRVLVFRASDLTEVFWQDGPMVCVLVSDAAPEEIVRIALDKARRA